MSAQKIKIKVKSQPTVVMEAEVARKIRQHARSSMKAEVCGVLIGSMDNDRTLIEACIAGINAAQGGAHVTFTQDTWEHIYKIKDEQYPDDKIVGWYHSHPGFGVFLSEHDLFIQENFFSSPQQVAWVYDPHTDEEGCFGWIGGKIDKLQGIRTGYSQSVAVDASAKSSEDEDGEEEAFESRISVSDGSAKEPLWMRILSQVLGYLAVLGLGLVFGYLGHAKLWAPRMQAFDELLPQLQFYQDVARECEPEIRSCAYRVRSTMVPGAGDLKTPAVNDPKQTAPAKSGEPGKGTNGKH